MEIECRFCKNVFVPTRKNNIFCSKQCKDNASKIRRGIKPTIEKTRECCECGTLFTTTFDNKKFCNKTCYYRKRNRIKRNNAPKTVKLIKLKDIKHPIETESRECVICGTVFEVDKRLSNKTCSHECSQRLAKAKARQQKDKRERKYQSNDIIPLELLYKRDQGICYICGLECNYQDYKITEGNFIAGPMYPSIEHTVPLALGGTHTWENVRLAHFRCNSIKGVAIGFNDMSKEKAREFAKERCKNKKEVIMLIDGVEYMRFDSTRQAADYFNYKDKSIQNACRGEGTGTKRNHRMYGAEWYYA